MHKFPTFCAVEQQCLYRLYFYEKDHEELILPSLRPYASLLIFLELSIDECSTILPDYESSSERTCSSSSSVFLVFQSKLIFFELGKPILDHGLVSDTVLPRVNINKIQWQTCVLLISNY